MLGDKSQLLVGFSVYCRPVKSLQPESHFFMHLTLWTWALSLWKRKNWDWELLPQMWTGIIVQHKCPSLFRRLNTLYCV